MRKTKSLRHPRKEEMIRLLLAGHTQSEAAKVIGCNHGTVSRWVREPEVALILATKRKERREAASAALDDAVPKAIAVLREAMETTKVPWGVRVRAAVELLKAAGVVAPTKLEVSGDIEVATDRDPAALLDAARSEERRLRELLNVVDAGSGDGS